MTTDPQALVQKLFQTHFKFAIASKLRDLGPVVIPYLEQALQEGTADAASLRQCAAVLLHFGNRTGVPYLLQDLTAPEGDAPFSALQLANIGHREALEPISRLLAGDIMKNLPNEAFVLIDAHQKLAPLPDDLQHHLHTQVPEKLRTDLTKALQSRRA